jgi:hypothetical protein
MRIVLCGGQGQWPDIFVSALISVQDLYTPSLTQTTIKEQLVEARRYKPENRGFDSRWGPSEFLLI